MKDKNKMKQKKTPTTVQERRELKPSSDFWGIPDGKNNCLNPFTVLSAKIGLENSMDAFLFEGK